jgi:hypothetical protein
MLQIVSGGQTGVDRGALDAALRTGAACGGWAPAGGVAEDGLIDARYGLVALPAGGYAERTRRNVEDSDATLILAFGAPTGGTALSADCCRELGKPLLLVDALVVSPAEAAQRARAFVVRHAVRRLNVAGPRASEAAAAHAYAWETVTLLLAQLPADSA